VLVFIRLIFMFCWSCIPV